MSPMAWAGAAAECRQRLNSLARGEHRRRGTVQMEQLIVVDANTAEEQGAGRWCQPATARTNDHLWCRQRAPVSIAIEAWVVGELPSMRRLPVMTSTSSRRPVVWRWGQQQAIG